MKHIPLLFIFVLTSCGMMPTLLNDVEHVIDDTAVSQKISIEALQKGTNVRSTIEVCNSKDDFPK
jgi:hypothetical protein